MRLKFKLKRLKTRMQVYLLGQLIRKLVRPKLRRFGTVTVLIELNTALDSQANTEVSYREEFVQDCIRSSNAMCKPLPYKL